MNFSELKKLSLALAQKKKTGSVANYSVENVVLTEEAMNETLRQELFEMCKDYYTYEENKWKLFSLISETIDAILPPELDKFFEGYADIKAYGETDKPEITLKRDNKNLRARSFITKVSPAGIYETFRLGKEGRFTIEMTAVGGAGEIAFEDFLTGRVDWNEILDIIAKGIEDRIYEELLAVVDKTEKSLPDANKGTSSDFDPKALEKVLDVVSVYGSPIIFCTETFAREITEGTDWASEKEKEARRNTGYLANYKNAKIVILPQSFTDETNTTKVVDSSKAYIFPEGRQGIFQIALQGATHVKDIESNSAWAKEIHTYKKFGVAAIVYNDIATYTITNLK